MKESSEIEKKTRQSGIELLRILAACAVVMIHYNDQRALVFSVGGINYTVLCLLNSLCICAVDLFILITGYFLCTTQKRSIAKPLELVVQVSLFNIFRHIGSTLFGVHRAITLKGLLLDAVPSNYFVILYMALYFISPYINMILKRLDTKGRQRFLLVMTFLFSFWATAVDLSQEILGFEWFGLSTIGAWGNQRGFNIVNFTFLYCIGAYLRLDGVSPKFQKKRFLVPALIFLVTGIFGWSLLDDRLAILDGHCAWMYHNPLVILTAVSLFLIFQSMKFQSKIVNNLARSSYTCYLFQNIILAHLDIQGAAQGPLWFLLLHIVGTIIGIYLVSYVVYQIYHLCTAWLFRRLSKRLEYRVE